MIPTEKARLKVEFGVKSQSLFHQVNDSNNNYFLYVTDKIEKSQSLFHQVNDSNDSLRLERKRLCRKVTIPFSSGQ